MNEYSQHSGCHMNFLCNFFSSQPSCCRTYQDTLQRFQSEMGNVAKDPFKVVMRKSHLPITLLQEKVSLSNQVIIIRSKALK